MSTRGICRTKAKGAHVVGAALCLSLVMMGGSARAHGEEMHEANPLSHEDIQKTSPSRSKEAGLQAASWLLTLPYGAAKVAYAVGGGVVGGLAWAMTGGKTEVAKSVWIPSMTGDYIVQPQHLTKEKPLRFLGVPSEAPSF
ncbi:hypothetical protein YTPLAS72_18920 [Nitrospira sp.]|nr:hypothetical protein YTPLAS72_18920 [Nitrospira sp.]